MHDPKFNGCLQGFVGKYIVENMCYKWSKELYVMLSNNMACYYHVRDADNYISTWHVPGMPGQTYDHYLAKSGCC